MDILFNSEMYNQWIMSHLSTSIIWTIAGVILLTVSILSIIYGIKHRDDYDFEESPFLIFIGVLGVLVGILQTTHNFILIINYMNYPQGMILEYLFNLF